MWRITLCVMLGSCGFQSSPGAASDDARPPGDAGSSASDAAGDAAIFDAPADMKKPPEDCIQRWLDGEPSLTLTSPQQINELTSAGDDRDPWISADGLRMYFARKPGAHGGNDLYFASRAGKTAAFGAVTVLDNLDTADEETRASLAGNDEKLLIFSGNHSVAAGQRQLFVSTRNSAMQSFPSPSAPDQALVAGVNLNLATIQYLDPFLTGDGLRMYLAPVAAGGPQRLALATRMAANQSFGAAATLSVVNSPEGDADPAVSTDERILVFSSHRPSGSGGLGATNLWYATRPSTAVDFSMPKLIPAVNSDQEDGDPMLSADGCELYFASTRNGDKYHLFRAELTK